MLSRDAQAIFSYFLAGNVGRIETLAGMLTDDQRLQIAEAFREAAAAVEPKMTPIDEPPNVLPPPQILAGRFRRKLEDLLRTGGAFVAALTPGSLPPSARTMFEAFESEMRLVRSQLDALSALERRRRGGAK
jgi:hypothetical protein